MSFVSWLQNTTSCGLQSCAQRQPIGRRFRPRLEALEDRCTPTTLTVTSTLGYAAPGSLTTDIGLAQKGDTIVFDPKLFTNGPQTISLSNPPGYFGGAIELFISKDLTIQGPGAGELAISGGGATRVFEIAQGANVAISGLTIEGGNATTGAYDPHPYDDYGGGILNEGTLTLSGCTVTDNALNSGVLYWGGGIANLGTMTMSDCTVTGNHAAYGGGIYNSGTLTVLSSTVINNSAADGADVLTDHLFTKKNSDIGQLKYF